MSRLNMRAGILNMLKGADRYISGQELCEHFGVSRTAVWKAVNQLKEEGYEIEAVQKKGYRLVSYQEKYSRCEIESRRMNATIGHFVKFYEELDSTNITAKKLAEEGAEEGTLVVCEVQKNGKGRRGRNWSSPGGTGIWMSLILKPDMPPSKASMITLVAGMAVSKAIEKVTGLQNRIKWPNDIVADGKKICGILTEMSAEMEQINYVIPGIGINVNMKEFPEDIAQKATSIAIETGKEVNRLELIDAVLSEFEFYYGKFLETKDMTNLMEEYNQRLINIGNKVLILQPSGDYEAISKGIDEKGELIVECEDGTERKIVSGEVSVRGVYGYV